MEEIKLNKILKFNDNQLIDVRRAVGYEDVNRLRQDLDQFEDWIKKQNHFVMKKFDRVFLERFLILNKGSLEKSKKRFDKLMTFNTLMPEFFQNIDVKNEFIYLLNCIDNCLLPKPSPDNYRILVTRVKETFDENFDIMQLFRFVVVLGEYLFIYDYCQGLEIICDTRNVSFALIKKFNPFIVHKALTLQAHVPVNRIKKIHFISGSKFMDTILTIAKQAMNEKMFKKIQIHDSYDSIYRAIPRETLPKDYGGYEKSIKEISEINYKEFISDEHIENVKYLEKAQTDENLRISSVFNEEYCGMPGSFKSLCVD